MSPLNRFRPRPLELLALLAVVATATTISLSGFRLQPATLLYTVMKNGPTLAAAFGVGVVLNLLYRLRKAGAVRAYLREIRTTTWLLDTLRIWAACVLLSFSYTWLKSLIPLVNPRRWDVELAWFDQVFHLGISPNRFLVALFEGTPVLAFIDWTYFLWLPFVLVLFGFFTTFPDPRTRAQFAFSHVALWTLGVWIYVAMPALGPALAFPDDWRSVHASMPKNSGGQVLLLQNYQTVLEARRTGRLGPGFNPAYGVAAMPSLHVGVDWLLLLWCLRRARPLAGLLLAAFVVTVLGSIATGWHYAVDAWVGIAIAHLAFWVATKTSRELPGETDEMARGAAPEPALEERAVPSRNPSGE